jgi:hypothetical protein
MIDNERPKNLFVGCMACVFYHGQCPTIFEGGFLSSIFNKKYLLSLLSDKNFLEKVRGQI